MVLLLQTQQGEPEEEIETRGNRSRWLGARRVRTSVEQRHASVANEFIWAGTSTYNVKPVLSGPN
ncbi:hypothetical protein BDN71DRAFT_1454540 [Pleurotus eryngii]|uniref:Uncharacterized protein n=1 Tax=Pleurotus eryngii TaxID=5323 RepID=A0A9P6DCC9_PLEER|nr:hypothetical protein BDN71DRAFT_1454540 [Pleurotus eryngii]